MIYYENNIMKSIFFWKYQKVRLFFFFFLGATESLVSFSVSMNNFDVVSRYITLYFPKRTHPFMCEYIIYLYP